MNTKLMSALGLESINFQSGVLFKELTMLYAALREANVPIAKIEASDEYKAIAACIKHHTGIAVKMTIDKDGPAVIIPRVNKNHTFFEDWRRHWGDDNDVYVSIKKAGGALAGSVNLATSTVSGVFADISSNIMMPYRWIDGSFASVTPEECAAVTLHEVGHLFSYYEFISRSVTTNQVLAALHRGYANVDTIAERTALLISAKKAMNLNKEGIEELAQSTDIAVVSAVLIKNSVDKSRSELGCNIYDLNSWEYLADEFAARHQSGKHLITALDKIHKKFGHMSYRGTGKYLYFEAIKLLLIAAGIATWVITPFSSVLIWMGYIAASMDCDAIIYDEPEARMRRIKQQIIQELKNRELPKEKVISLTEDIALIESITANVKDKHQWLAIIGAFVSKDMRKRKNAVSLQKELETLANNELFAKAATFKNM